MKYCTKCNVEMPDELETCIQCGSPLANGSPTTTQGDSEPDREKKKEWLSEQTKIKSELQDLISRLGGDPIRTPMSSSESRSEQPAKPPSSSSLETKDTQSSQLDKKTAELMNELADLKSEGYVVTRLESAIHTDPESAWKAFSEFLDDVDKLNELKTKLENMDTTGRELQISHIKSKLNNPDLVLELEGEIEKLEQSLPASDLETSTVEGVEEPVEPGKEPVTGEDVIKKLEELVESGKNAYRDGEFNKATEFFDKALILDPSNKQVQFFKKKTITKLEESSRADETIKSAQDELGAIAGEDAYESWDAEMESGSPKLKKGKKGKKKKKKEKAKKKKKAKGTVAKGDVETRSATELEALGFNAFINKNYDKALGFYEKVMEQDPNFPGVQARIDECKQKLG